MFSNMNIGARMSLGFFLVLVLTLAIGIIAEISSAQLSELTAKLYRHPFAVTNALSDANANIIAMHRSMKDVALSQTPEDLAKAVADVDAREKRVYDKFNLVRERFLGDKSDVEAAAKAFADWKPIRDQVIVAIRDNRREDAAEITKTKGAVQVASINATLDKVMVFAFDKAEAFMVNAQATKDRMTMITRLCLGGALILGVTVAWWITRGISRPINAMTGVMDQLSQNKLQVDVPYAGRGDEIGRMAKSVRHFKDQLVRVHQLEQEQEEQKRRAEVDRMTAMRKMADTFEGSVGAVINTVTSAATELQAASSQMAGTATETSAQATTVASSAQQASANVQTVASATDELAASIEEITHQVERAQTVSGRAGTEMDKATLQVEALSENVGKIGEIVSLIDHIASQTNLLALNATIEAARAGDAGKGFAVVANEVKGLANQTAKATSEIATQIQAVQQGTAAAVHAIGDVSSVIAEMAAISAAVAAAVEQQSGATNEIARNVEQAADGTQQVTENIVSVEQAARETGSAAEQISISATDLSKQAEYLRHEVGQFLSQVRADKTKMVLLTWTDNLASGVASIDAHHQEMFAQLNAFYGEMMAGDSGKGALTMLAAIERSMSTHFAEEEALMTKHRYGAADTHRGHHRDFLAKVALMRQDIEGQKPNAMANFFDYVSTWLAEHIGKEDKALFTALKTQAA
ncbi:putative methyl-accepting chemotaxis protein [Magnetospirillum gryphiswaldense MSR-1 v2]|uniref:Methyl-accepting chemotaxis protein n=2 Tax=Magnetospirillum gryphiswaldense TaxID=55518 RepID=V6EWQ4_MAGGM|nr:putative methyl-accepting chemotaxis protein [Magnetospirillum gryphiswaldense MSR-1 v2]